MIFTEQWDTRVLNTDKLFRALYLIHLGALMEPKTQVHGAVIIMDFGGLSYSQALAFSPTFTQRLITFIQVCQFICQYSIAYLSRNKSEKECVFWDIR